MEGGEEKLIEIGPDQLLDGIENDEEDFKGAPGQEKIITMLKLLMPLWIATVWGGVHYLAFMWSRHGVEDENPYTIKHYEFNSNLCQFFWKSALYMWFVLNTIRPQLRLRTCCCFNFCVWFILGCIRSCALAYFIYDVLPRIGFAIYLAWAYNWTNTWKSVEEPFLTNASKFNAGLCWYISCSIYAMSIHIILISFLILMVIVVMFVIYPIVLCVKPDKASNLYETSWNPILAGLLKITWDVDTTSLKPFIKTRVVRNDDGKEAQAKRDAFYKKQNNCCSKLFFDPAADCVICSQPIQVGDKVIKYGGCSCKKCSSCTKEYLAYPTKEKRCPRESCKYSSWDFPSMIDKRFEGSHD